MSARPRSTAAVRVLALRGERAIEWPETVVGEEPLEIRVAAPGEPSEAVAVTMRTPGNDFELAVGFLLSEGLLEGRQLRSVRYCTEVDEEQLHNAVTVDVAAPIALDGRRRRFTVSASCGVCGSASIDSLAARCERIAPGPEVPASVLLALPDKLRASQPVFDATGGVHAAGLFDRTGACLAVREDVGRHNAVDKLLGWRYFEGHPAPAAGAPAAGAPAAGAPPASALLAGEPAVLVVSGRVSFEIVQKAAVGRFPIVVAVSAPSSLAVETAARLGLTLVGFARGERANVYTCPERVRLRT